SRTALPRGRSPVASCHPASLLLCSRRSCYILRPGRISSQVSEGECTSSHRTQNTSLRVASGRPLGRLLRRGQRASRSREKESSLRTLDLLDSSLGARIGSPRRRPCPSTGLGRPSPVLQVLQVG